MLLFIDSETSGMPDWRAPSTSKQQPHLVQLAALLCDDDGTERASINVIIRPDGYDIPKEASDIHGITTDIAVALGVPLEPAVRLFNSLDANAGLLIAHNVSFDQRIMRIQRKRLLQKDTKGRTSFCTMRTATPICKIMHANPRHEKDYKWPRLGEAYQHFFGEELKGAHDALVDVRACKRIYFKLKELEQVDG